MELYLVFICISDELKIGRASGSVAGARPFDQLKQEKLVKLDYQQVLVMMMVMMVVTDQFVLMIQSQDQLKK